MFEQENALPCAKGKLAANNGKRKARLGESRADVSRHVVRPFVVMFVSRALRSNPLEIGLDVAAGGRRSILLDQQRRRGVAAEDGEQTFFHALRRDPAQDLPADIDETLAVGFDRKMSTGLAHTFG